MRKRFHERFNGSYPWQGNSLHACRVFVSDCWAELGYPDAAVFPGEDADDLATRPLSDLMPNGGFDQLVAAVSYTHLTLPTICSV
eukprot:4945839-Alexandrium_andersonii.AAC.1